MGNVSVEGLLIAAGYSGRMGKFKPLVKYNGESFVSVIARKLLTVCNKVTVVSGYNHKKLEDEIKKIGSKNIQVVYNPLFAEGMFSSLKKGLEFIDPTAWVIYHFVDQPNLPDVFYKNFVSKINETVNWIQPVNKGRKGHPILFDAFIIELIKNTGLNSSLRDISRNKKIKKYFYETDHSQIFTDIDKPEDLKQLS